MTNNDKTIIMHILSPVLVIDTLRTNRIPSTSKPHYKPQPCNYPSTPRTFKTVHSEPPHRSETTKRAEGNLIAPVPIRELAIDIKPS